MLAAPRVLQSQDSTSRRVAMTDFLTPEQRSERMARIRGRDTQPEVALRRELHRAGLRYRLHAKDLAGKPDLVFPRYRAVVFVHGCFWHRHQGCSIATMPKSNTRFWQEKFLRNVERDRVTEARLRDDGWRVFVIWECQLSSTVRARETADRLLMAIKKGTAPPSGT